MGCASSIVIQPKRVIPLPNHQINNYIDFYPTIIVQKLKQKFDAFADKEDNSMDNIAFAKLYSQNSIVPELMPKLYTFFTDDSGKKLKFRAFMSKYATLTKGEPKILFQIIFYLYKKSKEEEDLQRQQFDEFLKNEKSNIVQYPKNIKFPINVKRFVQICEKMEFKVQKYQKKYNLTSQNDIPFEAIKTELIQSDFNDLIPGRQYYVISLAWFERWSFYYQELTNNFEISNIKSTKLLTRKSDIKKPKNRVNSILKEGKSIDVYANEILIIRQPKQIQFDDIEGQYYGQLKENLNTRHQCKIITEKLWFMLCSLHPPQQTFKRTALDYENIDYYPKIIYFMEANRDGKIIKESQKLVLLSVTQKIDKFVTEKEKENRIISLFTKNFGEKNFREESYGRKIGEISHSRRIIIVKTHNRQNFYDRNHRQKQTIQNLTIGDKVYHHLSYTKKAEQAYIIQLISKQTVKIHYKGYSYLYEVEATIQELGMIEKEATLSSKKKHQYLFRGISNIGNTCFINSIMECLIGTPILEEYLKVNRFDENKQPLTYELAKIAENISKNQKPSAQELKKKIDINMPIFSGYDQHDAQEFLNLLLEKIKQQTKLSPQSIVDYLFLGKQQSHLTCIDCKSKKIIPEPLFILSLPIPEPQFNYFIILVVPVVKHTMKKVMMRLPKNAKIKQYVQQFQEKIGENVRNYIFCESNQNTLKKIRKEMVQPSYYNKVITDVGIVPNIQIIAFEKLATKFYFDLLNSKPEETLKKFKDIKIETNSLYSTKSNLKQTTQKQTIWTICKLGTVKSQKQTVQYFDSRQNQITNIKLNTDEIDDIITKLGSFSSQIAYKKLVLRKYNSTLKRMDYFGNQFLVGIPKWASYNDVIGIGKKFIKNLRQKDAKYFEKDHGGDYLIRLLDPGKVRCIFCLQENKSFNLKTQNLEVCCSNFDVDQPLIWSAKHKNYWLYVDWFDFSKCNGMFCSYIQMDYESRNVESKKQSERVTLDQCLKLHQMHENVQMECQKCKGPQQILQHKIQSIPNILIFHLKEFRYTNQGHLIKLDIHLKWQQVFDSSKYSLAHKNKLYELYAFVIHSGNSQSGHYTAVIKKKHPFENKEVWVNYDDDVTTIVEEQHKSINDAYLLFFKRVDMPTSAIVKFTEIVPTNSMVLSKND